MVWFRQTRREDADEYCRQHLRARLHAHARTPPVHTLLAQVLARADERASQDHPWPDAFAHALVAALSDLLHHLHAAEQAQTSLQSEVAYLRRRVDAYWRHPLQQQVREAERERDAYREEAERLHRQLAQAEQTLARERARWEQERTRLEQTIADLNRIVAEQQEALMASMEDDR